MTQNPLPSVGCRYDRCMSWLLPALLALTPFCIAYVFVYPHVAQTFFFMLCTFLMTAGLGIAWMFGWREMKIGRNFACAVIGGNLAVLVLSMFVSREDWLFSFRQSLLPLCGVLFFVHIVSHPQRPLVLMRMAKVMCTLSVFLAAYGILQHFGFEVLAYSEHIRKNNVISLIGHPNYLASVLGPSLFVMLGIMLQRRTWRWTLLGGTGLCLLMFCTVLARTRSVWAGVLLGSMILFVMVAHYLIHHKHNLTVLAYLAAGGALLVALLMLAIFVILPALGASIDILERIASEMEIQSRLFYWKAAIEQAFAHKLLGLGFGMFDPTFWDYVLNHQQSAMGTYYRDLLPAISGANPEHVHNEYLEVLCEQGFIGLTALMGLVMFFLVFGYRALMRMTNSRHALLGIAIYCGFVCNLVDAFFSFPWRLPVSLMLTVLMVAWIYDFIYPQEVYAGEDSQA